MAFMDYSNQNRKETGIQQAPVQEVTIAKQQAEVKVEPVKQNISPPQVSAKAQTSIKDSYVAS